MSEQLLQRLDRIETLLEQLISQRTVKDAYTPTEVAQILSEKPYTVQRMVSLEANQRQQERSAVAGRLRGVGGIPRGARTHQGPRPTSHSHQILSR